MNIKKIISIIQIIATFLSQFWLTLLLGYGLPGFPKAIVSNTSRNKQEKQTQYLQKLRLDV